MTAKTRVLLLPFLGLGFLVALIAVFYFRISCAVDGRESLGDKSEWSILQSLEAAQRDSPISALEFSEREGYHILCVPGIANSKRIWIILDPRSPPFYKQVPHDGYSLSREQYGQITATRHATSTVEESLSSHVR